MLKMPYTQNLFYIGCMKHFAILWNTYGDVLLNLKNFTFT